MVGCLVYLGQKKWSLKKGRWLKKYFPHGGQNKGRSNSEVTIGNLAKMPAQPKESLSSWSEARYQ